MSGHTPGPWLRDGSHIYAPDTECIAQVFNPGRTAEDYPLEANASLMTAAPELLEALVELAAWIDCAIAPNYTDRKPMPENCRNALAAAHAVIAKATQP